MDIDNMINYSLIDAESGQVFVVKLSRKEAAVLDLDHLKSHRLLQQLKSRQVAPARMWDVSSILEGDESVAVSEAQSPPPPGFVTSSPLTQTSSQRAQGKTGGKWNESSITTFLKACKAWKKELRQRVTKPEVWQAVSDSLFDGSPPYDYSLGQCSEKMRNMKRFFKEAKEGKHKGRAWPFFIDMADIFDNPLTSPCQSGGGGMQSMALSGRGLGLLHFHSVDDLSMEKEDENVDSLEVFTTEAHDSCTLEVRDCDQGISYVKPLHTTHVTVRRKLIGPSASTSSSEEFVHSDRDQDDTREVTGPKRNESVIDSTLLKSLGREEAATGSSSFSLVLEDAGTQEVHQQAIIDANIRSPFRKKNRKDAAAPTTPSGSGARPQKASTPQQTPRKRKVPKQSLEWKPETSEKLIDICVERKADMQVNMEAIPLRVWKEICASLNEGGLQVTWQECSAKFQVMRDFFTKSLIKKGGMYCGVRWPYYTRMCQIFDLPEDYVLVEDNTGIEEELDDEGSTQYEKKVLLMLSLYQERKCQFDSTKSGLRHDMIYMEMAKIMQMYEHPVTGSSCSRLMSKLKMEFRRHYDANRSTGNGQMAWKFFDRMLEIFKGSVTLEAPAVVSVGTTSSYTEHGKPKVDPQRQTRTTFPIPKKGTKTTKKSPNKGSVSWFQEYQMKQLQQKEATTNELRLMRLEANERFQKRQQLLQQAFDSMKVRES